MSKIIRLTLAVLVALCCMQSSAWALTANTAYTLELSKVNSDGTTTLVSSTSVTSDASGKIAFTFSDVPTQATNNFLIVTVKDANGNVQIKSFAPAPPAGSNNSLGVNTTTTAQANLMEQLGALIGTDDPIVVSFGLMFTRNPNLTTTDIANFAIIGQQAIINGMEPYMLANGATAAQMATFKSKLVYNSAAGSKDLSDFSALTKSAVDTPASTKADMAKASGLISSIFVDAAHAAGIDLDLVLAAFDSAGINLQSGAGLTAMNALSASFRNQMNQSVQNFFTQVASVKVKQVYSATLTTLGATAGQQTQFNTAVTQLTTDMGAADALFASYYDGTSGYDMTETLATAFGAGHLTQTGVLATLITAGTLTTASTVQAAMDAVYQKAFTNFQGATAGAGVQSTNADITTMQSNVATALAITTAQLLTSVPNLGKYYDFSGTQVNWPIPQTASVNFVAAAITAGGGMTYTRTTLAIPSNVTWMGTCTGGAGGPYYDQTSCTTAGGAWTPGRTNFGAGGLNMPASFAALMGMQEDIQIAEFTRYAIYDPTGAYGGNPSQSVQQTTKQTFISNLSQVAANIGGTTDGTTAFTTAQKNALVQAQQQPSLH